MSRTRNPKISAHAYTLYDYAMNTEDLYKSTKEFEEPDYCANCGSDQPMNFHKLSINGKDGIPGYVCEECGHAHYEKDDGPKRLLGS